MSLFALFAWHNYWIFLNIDLSCKGWCRQFDSVPQHHNFKTAEREGYCGEEFADRMASAMSRLIVAKARLCAATIAS